MFNKSIAYHLSVYLSLAVISVFIAFILITFFFNSKIITENIGNEAARESSKAYSLIVGQLYTTREITSNISEQVIYYAQHDDVILFISNLMEKYDFLNTVNIKIDPTIPNIKNHNYFIYNNNDSLIIKSGNENISLCKNEDIIFKEILANKKPAWSDVFNCAIDDKMVVSYYSPIQMMDENNNNITIGSVICELSLSELNDAVNNLKIGKNGYAILISKNGTYLTHPNKEWIFKKNVLSTSTNQYDSKQINIKEVLEKGLPFSTIVYPEHLNYKKSRVYYSAIKETGWATLIIIPYDELFEPLYLLILRMLFVSVIGILLIFFIVTFISNKLIEPLSEATTQLKKFSNLTGEAELNTLNEVKMVSESLNYLETWYEKFKITQNKEEKLNHQRRIDLLEASEIQMSLINTNFTTINKRKEINLYGIYKPARIVSGDLFDYFFIDDDNLFFSIGDVSGKGISAAFFMSVAQTIIKSQAFHKEPSGIVYNVNNKLYTTNQHQFFLTLFVGVLNVKTGLLKYCNAAHTPSVLLTKDKKNIELGQSHGMPLGIYKNTEYLNSNIILSEGDTIILFTDGVTDLQNEEKSSFGSERLRQTLQQNPEQNAHDLINRIEKELEEFKGKTKPVDDITILAVKYNHKKKA